MSLPELSGFYTSHGVCMVCAWTICFCVPNEYSRHTSHTLPVTSHMPCPHIPRALPSRLARHVPHALLIVSHAPCCHTSPVMSHTPCPSRPTWRMGRLHMTPRGASTTSGCPQAPYACTWPLPMSSDRLPVWTEQGRGQQGLSRPAQSMCTRPLGEC